MTEEEFPPPSYTGLAPRIFISAAEPSGDRHAAELIREILRECPQATFFGIAGPAMQGVGCLALDDLTDRAAMLLGAVGLAGHALKLLRKVEKSVREEPPDLAILVDSPALHLPMAKRLKRSGCRVLYYIAPQLWAWAPWRIKRLRRRVDRLAAILPFEQTYFRQRGMDAEFVGHPLVSQLTAEKPDQDEVERIRALGKPVIACLPGSRRHVIREVLPGQIEVCQAIRERYPDCVVVFAAASEQAAEAIRDARAEAGLPAEVLLERNAEILAAADLALCASGTATLEVAWHRTPMVVMYNGSKWGYRIVGRWLINTPHLSLVNILAGRRIVPEFMPYYDSTAPIIREALSILDSEPRRRTMRDDLDAVITSLGKTHAAARTAEIALSMIAPQATASADRASNSGSA